MVIDAAVTTCPVCGEPRTARGKTCGKRECIAERIKGRERVYVVRPLAERFWEKVDVRGADECWEWRGARVRHGYGRIGTVGREIDGAHRVSYRLHVGPIPAGMSVCHRCDNPPCVNPRHLFVGTQQDNWADMRAKGRGADPPHRRGHDNNTSKLTDQDVLAIRASQEGTASLARSYGVATSTIKRVRNGRTWAWLS